MIYSRRWNNEYNHQITILFNDSTKVLQIWSKEIKQLFEDGNEHMISMIENCSFDYFINCDGKF